MATPLREPEVTWFISHKENFTEIEEMCNRLYSRTGPLSQINVFDGTWWLYIYIYIKCTISCIYILYIKCSYCSYSCQGHNCCGVNNAVNNTHCTILNTDFLSKCHPIIQWLCSNLNRQHHHFTSLITASERNTEDVLFGLDKVHKNFGRNIPSLL